MLKMLNKKKYSEYPSSENLKMQDLLIDLKNTNLRIENLNEDIKKLKIENIFKVDNAYIANIDLKIEKLNTCFKKMNQENQDLTDNIEKLKSQNQSLVQVNKMVLILLIAMSLFNISMK